MVVPPFHPGQQVRDRTNPTQPGTVLSIELDDQLDVWIVCARFGSRRTAVEASHLELWEEQADPWADAARGVLGAARDLSTLLVYERLRAPPGPVGSSFGTAKATLLPFQFKPLVKFLENPSHSLLIADEVGLGKTIEAGYIHREWKLRHSVDTVLIVVPARLRTKWRDELLKRFDEQFEVVGARDVLGALNTVRSGGELRPFQWICSYESLRRDDVVAAIRDVTPPIDMIILDEAHRVRNRDTLQYKLASALCESAYSKLFLSATPLQTGLGDLHTLLDLLEPGRFGSAPDFQEFIDANLPIVRATGLIASGKFSEAAVEVKRLELHRLTEELARDSVVEELVLELESTTATRADRVRLQAAIGDLSLTGHVVTRSRKVEVFEKRALRTAQTVSVTLNTAERDVYNAVKEFSRLVYSGGGWGQSMAELTAYRYAASCIPAAIEYMLARLESHAGWDLNGEVDEDFLEEVAGPSPVPVSGVDRLRAALKYDADRDGDSKLEALVQALESIWSDDDEAKRPRRKIVLFSFFRRTLSYLSRRLSRLSITHERIDGGVPLPEREVRIAQFLGSTGCPLLLSSEVGGEGLDLQSASVIVNYDLPWNPMVVEQRIGRVDRIGQASDRIVILNLVCDGTVEDAILHRLYQRIHLFESALGEIEEILGPQDVQKLVLEYIRGNLTQDELRRRVDATADAAVRGRHQAEQLSERVDGILAADQAILDQLKLMVEGNRLPGPADVNQLLLGFLETEFPGVHVVGDPTKEVASLDLPLPARAAFQQWSEANQGSGRSLSGALRRGPVQITANGDVAMRHPRAEYVQSRHPLVQFAVAQMAARTTRAGEAFLCRAQVPALEPGIWLVGIWSLTRAGLDNESSLVAAATHLGVESSVCGEEAEPLLRALLSQVEEVDPRPSIEPSLIRSAATRLQRLFFRYKRSVEAAANAELRRRRARRRTSWGATLLQQLGRAEQHLAAMREGGRPFAIQMAEAKYKRRQDEYNRVMEELAGHSPVHVKDHEIAVVLVDVVREE